MRVVALVVACCVTLAAGPAGAAVQEGELPLVVVERVGTVLDRNARVAFADGVLATRGDEAAVIVRTDGLYLEFVEGELVGSASDVPPEARDGIGVLVEARHVTLQDLRVRGYRVGVLARRADGLSLVDADFADGFRQRLGSTWEREDSSDWLRPHANDAGEWRRHYGAAVCVERTVGLLVSGCRARGVQNGLILDGVEQAVVTSNDFSFLSGWGLAMWRTRTTVVAGNRFDFCVRGYAHGRYNRGQDSAGILLFEQCSDLRVERNSATHGGDGVFGFAGREALGEVAAPRDDFDHARRGSNHNLFDGNDLSYAAAHGLELTFSFDNTVRFNRLVGNAICGLWLGYGRDSLIEGNELAENGGGAYGKERGGLNAEHAQGLLVRANRFADQPVGVRMWTDADTELGTTPWALANGQGARDNEVSDNLFERLEAGLELEGATGTTLLRNRFDDVAEPLVITDTDVVTVTADERERLAAAVAGAEGPREAERLASLRANRVPPGAERYAGRQWIAVGPYGPHDWEAGRPWLQPTLRSSVHAYRLLAAPPSEDAPQLSARLDAPEGALALEAFDDRDGIALGAWRVVRPEAVARAAGEDDVGRLVPYRLEVAIEDGPTLVHEDAFVDARWHVRSFALSSDPREDPDGFARAAEEAPVRVLRADLELGFGSRGPAELFALDGEVAREAGLGADHFGTLATTRFALPAGRYVVRTVSDDGIRVHLDGRTVIDDWTHHAPRSHDAEFALDEARTIDLRVEHFELDGHAELRVRLERLP